MKVSEDKLLKAMEEALKEVKEMPTQQYMEELEKQEDDPEFSRLLMEVFG